MRIAYGIHGYGRGHATRALTLLPRLQTRHDLLIIAGGDAYDLLRPQYPVQRIPTFRYEYGKGANRSNAKTFLRNFPSALDLLLKGPAFETVRELLEEFAPDVVISDAEAWTHHAAKDLGIPRIGIDHFGIIAYCENPMPWYDRVYSMGDVTSYLRLMAEPERVIVSSFYSAPPRRDGVRVVGPLLRPEVRRAATSRRDSESLLVYLNKGQHQLTERVEAAIQETGLPVRLYGCDAQRPRGNITFRPLSNLPFLEDLARCRAVLATAGNQLVGEAMFLGKPMLVMPEDTVEQRLNARSLARMGIGARTTFDRITAEVIRNFLDRVPQYRTKISRVVEEGWEDAGEAIEQFLAELTAGESSEAREIHESESV